MKIQPLGNTVLLRPEKIEEKTESGFIMPESQDKPILIGTVEGVGKLCDKLLRKGQKVAYAKFSGSEIGDYILIGEADILGIIEEEICQHEFFEINSGYLKCRKCGFEKDPMIR
jgi:chaperonin GroES